ncbi:MAG: BMP family ABC transporter substrate-binding protein [Proteobacteria bacterium]|nr:BMP family ABC transporter substrate-binding protein [Pseudomonadota bacterium]MBI3495854.1 BMP family ABC transporter substrate-binding protein [Pseudomonadota bacterium]
MLRAFLIAASLWAMLAHGGARAEIVPAIVYAVGQKFDKSFNEAAYAGSQAFKSETGIAVLEFEPRAAAQFEQGIAALVRRGATDIVAVGFYYATPLAGLAPRFPKLRFTLIDAVAKQPNVQSIVFKEHEGAYLAGMLAAMVSKTGTVGFIGAMDIPLIRKFAVGYGEGVQAGKPDTRLILNYIGNTPAAFSDPTAGGELASSQFDRGADVIFAGAGASNFGVFQKAVDRGRLAIGVDANQNGLHPGTILTSQLKRVDLAVKRAFAGARDGSWRAGVIELGLEQDGVALAFDDNNAALVTAEMRQRLDGARRDIIAGRIKVTDATKQP